MAHTDYIKTEGGDGVTIAQFPRGRVFRVGNTLRVRGITVKIVHLDGWYGAVLQGDHSKLRINTRFMSRGINFRVVGIHGEFASVRAVDL